MNDDPGWRRRHASQLTTRPAATELQRERTRVPRKVEQHLAQIRGQLTADEAAFFDQAIAKIRDKRPEALTRIASLSVDAAVAALRMEMPRPSLTTRKEP